MVTLHCAKGYKLAGSAVVMCQENGTWFPRLSNCEPVEPTTDPSFNTASPDPLKNNTTQVPSAGPTGRLQGVSFGVGFVVGVAICLLVAFSVVMLFLLYLCRKNCRRSVRFSGPTISYFSDKHSEANVTLPDADELQSTSCANGTSLDATSV